MIKVSYTVIIFYTLFFIVSVIWSLLLRFTISLVKANHEHTRTYTLSIPYQKLYTIFNYVKIYLLSLPSLWFFEWLYIDIILFKRFRNDNIEIISISLFYLLIMTLLYKILLKDNQNKPISYPRTLLITAMLVAGSIPFFCSIVLFMFIAAGV